MEDRGTKDDVGGDVLVDDRETKDDERGGRCGRQRDKGRQKVGKGEGGVVVKDKETKDDVHVCGRCGGRQRDKERRKLEYKETKDDERVYGRGLEFVVGYKG